VENEAMQKSDPFREVHRRPHAEGPFEREEVLLANRNSGILLETLRHDVTPIGLHYLLNHFDVPYVEGDDWQVEVTGRVKSPRSFTLEEIKALPARTLRVTLECSGNGRAAMAPRSRSMPWHCEAVGTADWTGTPLHRVLDQAGLLDDAVDIAFLGADRGFDRGHEHNYGRSLAKDVAIQDDILLVWAMNGAPLLPQHGFPLRLVVPGWYGMASVKWLDRIEVLAQPYDGFQQVSTYMYRSVPDGPTTPISHIRVKSLLVPPGIPDWYTRRRMVDAGKVRLFGRAWSGAGVPVKRVEVGIDGKWHEAQLEESKGRYAWRGFHFDWDATAGECELASRATDADGNTQPLETFWDSGGFGNNVVQRMHVIVR
jgi:DMSO/TMAO reductase YedYZ molybdopterin-dependent catalytic subunit